MGKRKKGGLNPAEAFRKKMRKKELKRVHSRVELQLSYLFELTYVLV